MDAETIESLALLSAPKPQLAAAVIMLRRQLAMHDGCSRWGTRDMRVMHDTGIDKKPLASLIMDAQMALRGDSNDAEHDALFALVESLKELR